MNILIVNDDGPDAEGLQTLRHAARSVYKEAKIITLVPDKPRSGAGMSVTTSLKVLGWKGDEGDLTPLPGDPNAWSVPYTPTDCVDLAFQSWDLFLARPTWAMVLCGVNHGYNLGLDILRSGTLGAAITAATGYGTAAIAFSTESGDPKQPLTKQQAGIVADVIRSTPPTSGTCWNVNIPQNPTKGYANVNAAHYSHHRMPPTSTVPRAKNEKSDMTETAKGYVTLSRIQVRLNDMLAY